MVLKRETFVNGFQKNPIYYGGVLRLFLLPLILKQVFDHPLWFRVLTVYGRICRRIIGQQMLRLEGTRALGPGLYFPRVSSLDFLIILLRNNLLHIILFQNLFEEEPQEVVDPDVLEQTPNKFVKQGAIVPQLIDALHLARLDVENRLDKHELLIRTLAKAAFHLQRIVQIVREKVHQRHRDFGLMAE